MYTQVHVIKLSLGTFVLLCVNVILLNYPGTMIYKSKKSKKWKGILLLTPIALMHTPHLDSHKHPRTEYMYVCVQL